MSVAKNKNRIGSVWSVKQTAITPLLPRWSARTGTANRVTVLVTDKVTKAPAASPGETPSDSAMATRYTSTMAWPAQPQKWMPMRFQKVRVRWACLKNTRVRIRAISPRWTSLTGSLSEAPSGLSPICAGSL